MPAAACVSDISNQGGSICGPGFAGRSAQLPAAATTRNISQPVRNWVRQGYDGLPTLHAGETCGCGSQRRSGSRNGEHRMRPTLPLQPTVRPGALFRLCRGRFPKQLGGVHGCR